jgi:hypothetical protein
MSHQHQRNWSKSTYQVDGKSIHGKEYQNERRKEVISLEPTPSDRLEAHAESSKQNERPNAIKSPNFV